MTAVSVYPELISYVNYKLSVTYGNLKFNLHPSNCHPTSSSWIIYLRTDTTLLSLFFTDYVTILLTEMDISHLTVNSRNKNYNNMDALEVSQQKEEISWH